MGLNIGDFGSFNFELPDYSSIDADLGQPPRKIDLDPKEELLVKEIMNNLASTGLTVESLFELFNDWQSDKTKSIKRFLLSISFILTLTIVSGVEITEIDLFSIQVEEGMTVIFLLSLGFILLISNFYYEYLRRKDKEIYNAKIAFVDEGLENCINMVDHIDSILEKKNIQSANELFNDFKSSYDTSNLDLQAYEAIKFYKNNLKDTREDIDWVEKLELAGIYSLSILGFIAIFISF